MIKINNVNKTYKKGNSGKFKVIDNTTLTLPNSGLVVFLGSSGSGKSTLINCIGGLENFDSGTITYEDSITSKSTSNKLDKYRAEHIGYVFQHYYLMEHLTVEENVRVSLDIINYKSEENIKDITFNALKLVGMENYRKRKAGYLSGGQQQRVAIARALAKDPQILICDEPTGNLDSKNTYNVMEILKQVSQEKLVLLVTHEHEIAKYYADVIINVSDGKVDDTALDNVSSDLSESEEIDIFLDEYNKIDALVPNKEIVSYSKDDSVTNIDVVIINNKIYIKSSDNINLIDTKESRINIVESSEDKIGNSNVSAKHVDLSGIKIEKDFDKTSLIKRFLKDIKASFEGFNLKKFKTYINIFMFMALSFGFLFSMQYALYTSTPNEYLADQYYTDSVGVKPKDAPNDITLDDSVWVNSVSDASYSNYFAPSVTIDLGSFDNYSGFRWESIHTSFRNIETINKYDVLAGELTEDTYDFVISKKLAEVILSYPLVQSVGFEDYKDVLNIHLSISGLVAKKSTAVVDTEDVAIYMSEELYMKLNSSDYWYDNGRIFTQDESDWIITEYTDTLEDNQILVHESSNYSVGDTYKADYYNLNVVREYTVVGTFTYNKDDSYYNLFNTSEWYDDYDVVLNSNVAMTEHNYRLYNMYIRSYDYQYRIALVGEIDSYVEYFSSIGVEYYTSTNIFSSLFAEESSIFTYVALVASILILILLFVLFRIQLMRNFNEVSTLRILGYTKYQILRQHTIKALIYFIIYATIPVMLLYSINSKEYINLQSVANIYTYSSFILPVISLLLIYIIASTMTLVLMLFRKSTIQLINTHDV